MRKTAFVFVVIGLAAVPLAAQNRRVWDGDRNQGIPPGHLPPPGTCRVWYDGTPPGHQPPPTSCQEAERIASRDRDARVIYGSNVYDGDGRWRDRDDDQRDREFGRAIPRYPYDDGRHPSGSPNVGRGYGYRSVPFDNGYKDGYDKGRDDARDNHLFDPFRQKRYRSGDHGYDRGYGSKDEYRDIYRDGFREGYEAGYRAADDWRRRN